jgi:hypothetical protein
MTVSKELRIDFQGVVAFVPDRAFSKKPTKVEAVLRDLEEARFILDAKGTPRLVGSHNAWLEFQPGDRVKSANDRKGVAEVTNGWTGKTLSVLLLRREYVTIRLDGKQLPQVAVAIDASVLAHLAVYQGKLKSGYVPNPKGSDEIAAAFPLAGGTLSVVEKTAELYEVPLHNGNGQLTSTAVATTLRWTIPFDQEVVLRFAPSPTSPTLEFRPAGNVLLLAVRNRELAELLKPPMPAMGGQDDVEYVVYGDSIVGGQPQVLRSTKGSIPGGHRACGTAGIQP